MIVDETSMVSLSLMARLLEAVRTDARVVLVGDPDQLSAIEAGAVLRDIVGPAADGSLIGAGMRAVLRRVAGGEPAGDPPAGRSFGDGVVVLSRGHRYGAAIAIARARPFATATPTARWRRSAAGGDEIAWLPGTPTRRGARPAARARRRLLRSRRRGRARRRRRRRAGRARRFPVALRPPPGRVRRRQLGGPGGALAGRRDRGF